MRKKTEGLIISILCAFLIISCCGSENTFAQKKELPIYCVDTNEKKIALTIDVNWADDEHLDEILNILKEKDIKATFFIIGSWVNYAPENAEKLKRINESGHEIGNHSYSHPDYTKISSDKMISEIKKTNEIIKNTTGVMPKYFRFPSGAYNNAAVNNIKVNGYIPIQWDVDSLDWTSTSAEAEYDRVTKKVKSGSIILYHNNGKFTTKSMSRVIDTLKNDNYKFVTIDELLIKENYYVDNEGRQKIIY